MFIREGVTMYLTADAIETALGLEIREYAGPGAIQRRYFVRADGTETGHV